MNRSVCCVRQVWVADDGIYPFGESWGDARWRDTHGMCSWCGHPTPLPGHYVQHPTPFASEHGPCPVCAAGIGQLELFA